MEHTHTFKRIVMLLICVASVAGCGTESSRTDPGLPIKNSANLLGRNTPISEVAGAPAWVYKGGHFSAANGKKLFYGVGSAVVMGDLALQKATADDAARAESGRLFSRFITGITEDYLMVAAAENIVIEKAVLRTEIEKMRGSIAASTRISGSWRDIKSNVVWVAATLDLALVKSQMAASTELDERYKGYFDASADIVFERLVQE